MSTLTIRGSGQGDNQQGCEDMDSRGREALTFDDKIESFKIDKELKALVYERAAVERISVAQWIRQAIADRLDKYSA